MKSIVVLRFSHFPGAGKDGVVSSLHAELYEGALDQRGNEFQYSYNAFASGLISFHKEAIVIHDALRAKLPTSCRFRECKPGRVLYFPFWKALDIVIDRNQSEAIEVNGVFQSFPLAPDVLRENCPYWAILSEKPAAVVQREVSFSSRCAMSKVMVDLPIDGYSEPYFYSDRIIWVFSESFFTLIDKFVDRDLYCVTVVD